MSERGQGLGTRTLRGMAWAYGAYVGGRVLVLVSTAILARLLTPKDFGVVALALVFTVFLEAVKDLGLGQALIVASDAEEPDRAQTVFAWSVVLGVALTILAAAISPLVASFFHQSQLKELLPVLALNFILRALGTTHYALARKHLNYRVRTVSEICEVSVRGVVGIALALAGAGAWSLVLGFVAGVLASTVALWLQVPFRPRMQLSRTHLRDLLRFGGVLSIVDVGAVIFYNTDYLFIGRVLGAASLGLYTIGFRIPELAILNVAHVAADVLFPAYSALDRGRLREGYIASLRYLTMLTVPLAAGLAVLARPVILVVFGHQWSGSISVTRAIAAYTLFATLAIPPGTVLKVTRRAWLMVGFSIPVIFILAGLLVIFTDQGILAVALATTALQATIAPMQATIVSRQLGLPLWASVRELIPPVLAAAAMAAALLGVNTWISTPVIALLVGVPLGAVVYLGVLWLLAAEQLRTLRRMAFPGAVAPSEPA
ncbi:MAG TPA: lipopolysaccharide biosynthesis protein [Solirubrobacteraceae bacterium]|jgi:PST family polysaccharide transporter|nr:lipopolysaccharide biosynthesis protein [Solirubrobacteraceae bacterium]